MGYKDAAPVNSIELGDYIDTGLTWRNNKWDDSQDKYGEKIMKLRCTIGKK